MAAADSGPPAAVPPDSHQPATAGQNAPSPGGKPFRTALIALIGRPNSGKSTLLNAVLGEQLSVVTPLPQTTRKNLKGIYNSKNMQLVFIDTPGMHAGGRAFNESMMRESRGALADRGIDILCYIVDLSREFGPEEDLAAGLVAKARQPACIVFNKADVCPEPPDKVAAFFERYRTLRERPTVILSATAANARDTFIACLRPMLPEGPALFPVDELTDANLRFFAAEYLRKHIILNTRDEVPHAAFVEITEYRESAERHEINATIHVETIGQRGIIVGKGGTLVNRIRHAAEKEMAALAGAPVSITCHIKITPRWRDNPRFLRDMGYRAD